MLSLSLSLGAWLSGPLIDRQFGDRTVLERGLDAFARLVVSGIVLLHVLPHGLFVGGWRALVAFCLAAVAPVAAERYLPNQARWTSALSLALLGGLLVHAFIDGVALGGPSDEEGKLLALGVVLHGAPLGLFVWRTVRLRVGTRAAAIALGTASLATIAGFACARLTPVSEDQVGVALFESVIGGVLLHVLSHGELCETQEERTSSGIGAIAAVAVVVGLLVAYPIPRRYPSELGGIDTFATLALASAPWLIAGYGLAALIGFLRPAGDPDRRVPVAESALGALLSVPLLGPVVALAPAAGAALLTGVSGLARPASPARFRDALRFGFAERVDGTAPWILLGLAAAALVEPMTDGPFLTALPSAPAVVGLALSGALGWVPLAFAVPVGAILVHKGLSAAAVAALLAATVAASLGSGDRSRAQVAGSVAAAIAVGLAVHALGVTDLPSLHAIEARPHPALEYASAGVMVALVAASLLRGGLDAFLGRFGHDLHPHEH